MNLVVDFGNTRQKLALFDKEGKLFHWGVFKELPEETIKDFLGDRKPEAYIVSSVIKSSFEQFSFIEAFSVFLNQKTPIPIKNDYQTPETLGADRIAVAVAANQLFPDKDVLVIDAGTTITYEFKTKNGRYLGGGISPGIVMRFTALNNYTARLPLIEFDHQLPDLIGSTSEKSIKSGVINGVVAEMEGVISAYKKKYSGLQIIITGGDSLFFEKAIKSSIFADENLVLKGLNEILEYNKV